MENWRFYHKRFSTIFLLFVTIFLALTCSITSILTTCHGGGCEAEKNEENSAIESLDVENQSTEETTWVYIGDEYYYVNIGVYPQSYYGTTSPSGVTLQYSFIIETGKSSTATVSVYSDGTDEYAKVTTSGVVGWFNVEPITWVLSKSDEEEISTNGTLSSFSVVSQELVVFGCVTSECVGGFNWIDSSIVSNLNTVLTNESSSFSAAESSTTTYYGFKNGVYQDMLATETEKATNYAQIASLDELTSFMSYSYSTTDFVAFLASGGTETSGGEKAAYWTRDLFTDTYDAYFDNGIYVDISGVVSNSFLSNGMGAKLSMTISQATLSPLYFTYDETTGDTTVSIIDPTYEGEIEIPESVSYGGENHSVTTISDFSNCTKLTSVDIPSSVTKIADGAFEGCTSLTEIDLSGTNIETIGKSAFSGCTALQSVTLPSTFKEAGEDAFLGDEAITYVNFLGDVVQWLKVSFANETANPTYYSQGMYFNGEYLTSVDLSYLDEEEETASETVVYVSGDEDVVVTMPDDSEKTSSVTISKATSGSGSVTFKFSSSSSITTAIANNTIPSVVSSSDTSSVDTETERHFVDEDGNVVMTADLSATTLTSISAYVLINCVDFTSIILPSTITSIGESAFKGCTGLEYVGFTGTLEEWAQIYFGDKYANPIFYAKSLVIQDEEVMNIDLSEGSLAYISAYAFINLVDVTSVSLPSSVKSIGESAFCGCTSISSVSFGGTVEEWAQINFGDLYSNPIYFTQSLEIDGEEITGVDLGEGTLTYVSDYAFYGLSGIESINLPSTVLSIGSMAFYECAGVTQISLAEGLTSIGSKAFSGISFGATEVEYTTFYEQASQETKELYDSLADIGLATNATYSLYGQQTTLNVYTDYYYNRDGYVGVSVRLPSTITYIGKDAFKTDAAFRIDCSSTSVLELLEAAVDGFYVDQSLDIESNASAYSAKNGNLTYLVDVYDSTGAVPLYYSTIADYVNSSENIIESDDYYLVLPYDTSYTLVVYCYIYAPSDTTEEIDSYGSTTTTSYYLSRLVETYNFETTTYQGDVTTIAYQTSTNTYISGTSTKSDDIYYTFTGAVGSNGKLTLTHWATYTISSSSSTTTVDPCFVEGSLVTLADGSTKAVEDVTYDDLLLVWNFDIGEFDASYPVWISKQLSTIKYYEITFDDGSVFKNVVAHRLFSLDELYFVKSVDAKFSQVGHNFLAVLTDDDGNAIPDEDGNIQWTSKQIVSIEIIVEDVYYYNLVTAYSMNIFVSSICASTGMNNLYGTMTEDLTYDLEKVAERQAGGYGEDGTMYSYDEFDSEQVPIYMYYGLRLAEQKSVREIDAINEYVREDLVVMSPLETDEEGNIIWIVSYSDEDVLSEDYVKSKVVMGSTVTLRAPTVEEDFVGWYCSSDGKTYQVGDEVTIWAGTYFRARYG